MLLTTQAPAIAGAWVQTSVTADDGALPSALVATLAYHDLLDIPLTAVELWRYLVRPRSVSLHAPTLLEVQRALTVLAVEGVLVTAKGYYTFPAREDLVDERIRRHARAQEKWVRLRRVAWWLQAVPFLRMVAGSGSLAREVARESSDLDVLIVAEAGRLWTVRFLVTVLLDVFRLRRRPTGPTQDLVCLNHYVAHDSLRLPYHSLYTALEYARLVPLVGEDVCRRFREANREWMEEFLVRVLPDVASHGKRVRASRVLWSIQRACEWLLDGQFGNGLERVLRSLQHRRITRSEERTEPAGRVIASDVHLEFHPRSHEGPLLAAFNARMSALGLEMFGGQEDSGLT